MPAKRKTKRTKKPKKETNKFIDQKHWDELASTRTGRMVLVANYGFGAFCALYLFEYFYDEMGDVHDLIIDAIEDMNERFMTITSFRECGKSTIATFAYPIYLICMEQVKFMIVISDTGAQTEMMIMNLKAELEDNKYLLEDFGNLKTEYWGTKTFTTSTGIKVLGRSKGQKVRGLRFRKYRPQVIIMDDIETMEDVRTKERRQKTYRWFYSEVMPALGMADGRLIYIGNLLHKECLLMRLSRKEVFISYHIALTDDGEFNGAPMWLARYPNKLAILRERKKHDPIVWQREYMLKIVPEEGQIFEDSDIQYYSIKPNREHYASSVIGIDLAISKKETADSTGMIGVHVYWQDGKPAIYIDPHMINAKLNFAETLITAKEYSMYIGGSIHAAMYIEKVAYQQAAIEALQNELLPAFGITPGGQDKTARLKSMSGLIKNNLYFPESGAEDLISQLVGWGIESHDDLVDALVYSLRGVVEQGFEKAKIIS